MLDSREGGNGIRYPLFIFSIKQLFRFAAFTCCCLLLAACATTSQPLPETGYAVLDACSARAASFRQLVASEGRRNAGVPANPAAPFLHGTRHTDLLLTELQSDAQAQELLSYMARLGADIRRAENNTLSVPLSDQQLEAINRCSFQLALDIEQVQSRSVLVTRLVAQPTVPESYRSLPRIFGAHALLRPIFSWRIDLLHAEEREAFSQQNPLGQTRSYQLSSSSTLDPLSQFESMTQFSAAYARSPLALPQLDQQTLARLIQQHAPEIVIETRGKQDLMGTPTLSGEEIKIDTDLATAYFLPGITRLSGRNLLQLNYVFWLPARGPRSWIDLYAGAVDSLIWRVTLDENGNVLLYDSIHSCGCYQKFYLASNRIRPRAVPLSEEPANVFDLTELTEFTESASSGQAMRVYLTHNEHYVVGVESRTNASPEDVSYRLAPYQSLYNIEDAGSYRSLFGPDGIIPGTERLERFTLWPTGINNVGAMRQWGTHATGFVNRQHFDDATLLDYYFQIQD